MYKRQEGYIGCWLPAAQGWDPSASTAPEPVYELFTNETVLEAVRSGDEKLVSGLAAFKIIKLVRLLKLARIFKASRVLKRLVADVLQTRLEMSFAHIKLLQLFLTICLVTHWQACIWALCAVNMSEGDRSERDLTWLDVHIDGELANNRAPEVTSFNIYITSLYWSVMTLTSIGYGDVVPKNTAERVLCCTFMILSGVTWTYVLGTAAGIASTLDPNAVLYQNTMDQLNYFMRDRRLDREMRHNLSLIHI